MRVGSGGAGHTSPFVSRAGRLAQLASMANNPATSAAPTARPRRRVDARGPAKLAHIRVVMFTDPPFVVACAARALQSGVGYSKTGDHALVFERSTSSSLRYRLV